ncbi:hypothetical protein CS063_13810 [Sporanaerobium hydrogeniformans]|uniref:Uncharacterized protein n=1 Tax=Sporanaerobium hydrogeniformans TaxID=3072179 RepID=A0AC61D8T1_9FIRM|nr:hypothetical protein [Sporanaerobium hydrogeniformans]PHV69789.1 hypothetical protein CS063_13810 [Sporanaerobium hydrogeniformans]
MKNEFLDYNRKILEKSNLSLEYTEAKEKEEIRLKDGIERVYKTKYLTLHDRIGVQPIDLQSNPILANLCVFSMFDMNIDIIYPTAEGKSFKAKYDLIECDDNIGIITKAFYRIFKVIRNAMTHSIDSIKMEQGNNIIDYTFKGTKFYLEISDKSLVELYTATIILLDSKISEKRGSKFKEGILSYYYNQIIENITIKDDISQSNGFTQLIYELDPRREIVVNAVYSIEGNKIKIKNAELDNTEKRDFVIKYNDKCYIIPLEVLEENCINIGNLLEWEADNSYLTI